MKLAVLIGLLGICVAAADPPPQDEGPLHPEGGLPAGYSWKLHRGPDFDVYYAVKGKSDPANAGIYIGTAPDFHPPDKATTEEGEFAGHKITWRIWTESGIIHRETVLRFNPLEAPIFGMLHIWVIGPNRAAVTSMAAGLKQTKLVEPGATTQPSPTTQRS